VKRDQKLIVAAVAVPVVALAGGGAGILLPPPAPPPPPRPRPAPPPVLARDVPIGPDGRLSVQFVGGTLLAGAGQQQGDEQGYDRPLERVRAALGADFSIAAAESPISAVTVPWSFEKADSRSTAPGAAGALARAGIDAMTLANDHIFDVGPVGITDTISNLQAAGIAGFGAGPDIARARQPLLLRSELGTIAVVGLGDGHDDHAGRNAPGALALSPANIERAAASARRNGADWVIADVHWGDADGPVNGAQRYWAQQLAAAGYDMVVGTGPRSTQPIEFVGAVPVVYSVGDFVRPPGAPGVGLSVAAELGPDGPAQLSVHCVVAGDAAAGSPRPCTPAEAQTHLPALHPEMSVQGDAGVLRCACFPRRTTVVPDARPAGG